jgi:two-component system, NarL family, invasion response regulator UvrY
MIKVLIADDHAVVRKGLKQIIQEKTSLVVAGEAANGQEALDLVRKENWDVVLLDISLPLRNGMEVLQEIKRSQPELPVLMLSIYPEEQFGIRVLRAGASGYMNKECALDDLVQAIHKVVEGGKYVSPTLAERFAFELCGDLKKEAHEYLSNREYDVMRMLGTGRPPAEIAHELSLSVKTVSTYRARVLEKLNLKTNAELIRYVLDHRLSL